MKKSTVTVLSLVVILAAGIYFAAKPKNNQSMQSQNKVNNEMDSTPMNKDSMMTKNSTEHMETNSNMEKKAGVYTDYSAEALNEAFKNNGRVVLFFHAKWCPFCKEADKAFSSRAAEIPTGVTVLKTDYDTQKELKTKYGVTYQHTFVQVDSNKNQVTKWNGGDIEELIKNLK